jgi:hypothetical protein
MKCPFPGGQNILQGGHGGHISDTMEDCSKGFVDYPFLKGAQIVKYSHVNSTIIGKDHQHPKVWLPVNGGANDFAWFCWCTVMMTVQDNCGFGLLCAKTVEETLPPTDKELKIFREKVDPIDMLPADDKPKP